MPNLYVCEQGATVRKKGRELKIEKNGELLLKVEVHRLDTVVLYGNVQFSTQVLQVLMREGIEVALLSRSGKLYGQVTPPAPKNILLRQNQFSKFDIVDFCLMQSRKLVHAKLRNSAEFLKQLNWNRRDIDLREHIEDIAKQQKMVDSATSIASLNGIEGNAARIYFRGYAEGFLDKSLFRGRSRRPPKDEANALMSFGYVLLASIVQSQLDAVGFDPYLGFYHQRSYGRQSLALDMMEVFRSWIVDRFVLRAFNLGIFQKGDFDRNPSDGARLKDYALKKFFFRWDEHLDTCGFRSILNKQVDSLTNVCKGRSRFPDYHLFGAR